MRKILFLALCRNFVGKIISGFDPQVREAGDSKGFGRLLVGGQMLQAYQRSIPFCDGGLIGAQRKMELGLRASELIK